MRVRITVLLGKAVICIRLAFGKIPFARQALTSRKKSNTTFAHSITRSPAFDGRTPNLLFEAQTGSHRAYIFAPILVTILGDLLSIGKRLPR